MSKNEVSFSIARHAAWAPGVTSSARWSEWAAQPWRIEPGEGPKLAAMPAMLRRRAGLLGRMALEVAYDCLGQEADVPTVFCSRHGEVGRAIGLLQDLARGEPLSPTAFGLAVHNASAGLFSIARADRANHIALAAGSASVEHAVIEACSLLADGAPSVLLVACDEPLPALLSSFEDCDEQPYAFAGSWCRQASVRCACPGAAKSRKRRPRPRPAAWKCCASSWVKPIVWNAARARSAGPGAAMLEKLGLCWRVLATGLSFAVFGLGGLVLRVIVFPLLALCVREQGARVRAARATIRLTFRAFVGLMRGLGVLRYEVHGWTSSIAPASSFSRITRR
nr:beta-ketoacyl synthase chain length factor [Massilia sp. Dwa41.01b]